MSDATHTLRLLGEGVRLEGPGGAIPVGGRTALLLAILALGGSTARSRAAGLLWPDVPEARARANLRQAVLRARRRGVPIRPVEPLRLDGAVAVDVHAALGEGPTSAGDRGDAEAGRSGGDRLGTLELLAGVDASFSPPLEAWLDDQRTRVAQALRARLAEAAEAASAAGDLERAIVHARRLVAVDPDSEAAHRRLMELQLEGGDPGGALATYELLRGRLERQLDALPSPSVRGVAARAAARLAGRVREGTERTRASGDDPAALARAAERTGRLREAAALLRLAAREPRPPEEQGRLLVDLAWLEHQLGHARHAEAAATGAVQLLRGAGADGALVGALFVLGSLARHRGDGDGAGRLWREALDRSAAVDDAERVRLHLDLALVEDALDDAGAARAHYLEVLRLARPGRDDRARATALNNLGHERAASGHLEDARALLGRALALTHQLGDGQLEGHVLDGLARVERPRDPAHARSLAARAVQRARATGDAALFVDALTTLALCSVDAGDPAAARAALRLALEEAHACGYGPGAARAGDALAGLAARAGPAPPDGDARVTPDRAGSG